MLSDRFRVVLSPERLLKKTPFEESEDEEVPFLQLSLTKA